MAEHRSEPLIDARLDRELAGLLDVTPSPEFAARVRIAVAGERMRSTPWRTLWMPIAATAVLGVVLYVGADFPGLSGVEGSRPVPPPAIAMADAGKREVSEMVAGAGVPGPSAVEGSRSVLVSSSEADGLRSLREAIDTGIITAESFAAAHSADPFEPIAIEPLTPPADLE